MRLLFLHGWTGVVGGRKPTFLNGNGHDVLNPALPDVIPFANSEELVANSGLPAETLIEVGTDHRLADAESLKAMLEAIERTRN